MRQVVVAHRARDCKVCALPPAQLAEVNAAIWPEVGEKARSKDYRLAGVRVCAAYDLDVDPKTITRHAIHIERSWHRSSPNSKPGAGEIAVFPTDYQSIVTQAATIGAQAMGKIAERIEDLEPRELVAVAKLGVTASTNREALRMRAQEVDQAATIVQALMGFASGHLTEADLPSDVEVIDVTPKEVLLAEVQAERAALKRLAAGEADGAR